MTKNFQKLESVSNTKIVSVLVLSSILGIFLVILLDLLKIQVNAYMNKLELSFLGWQVFESRVCETSYEHKVQSL